MQILTAALGLVSAVASVLLFLQLRWPAPGPFILKLFVSALSPVLATVGAVVLAAGLASGSVFLSLLGLYVALVFLLHIFRTTRAPGSADGFAQAFGPDWETGLRPEQKRCFLPRRLTLTLPVVPHPRLEQDLAFYTIPGTDRQIRCDLWRPPEGATPSGLGFIYLHGSAWYLLDKDLGTRPFFTHLTAQGHVVMDVAYRLAPETDMMGMVHDVKRAIAWMKANAQIYGIDPDRMVVGGASSGGHLALLAAYTANDSSFTPEELVARDISARAVISLYGPADLEACYYHTNQHLTTRAEPDRPKKAAPTEMPDWIRKRMGTDYHRLGFDKGMEDAGALAPLLGGHPDERPEAYAFFSPVSHVHPACPPTLLIQGEHDIISPVPAVRRLRARLAEVNVPTVLHLLPQTDHAFDLIQPKISPSARNAIYDVERFLALMARC